MRFRETTRNTFVLHSAAIARFGPQENNLDHVVFWLKIDESNLLGGPLPSCVILLDILSIRWSP